MENSNQQIEQIKWQESYNTGIEEIDEQHKILVNTINEANIKLHDDDSIATLEAITKDLLSYVLYHFETEEEMMAKHDYKSHSKEDYETHMKQHRDFSAKVVAVRESITKGKPIEKKELIEFLTNWLINHINKTDQKLGAFLDTKR
jgi:hemerythrin-like metal-binding protein